MNKNLVWARIMVLFCSLALCNVSFGESTNTVTEEPGALAMATDLIAVRPVMLGVTIIGAGLWLIALPFTAAGGNIKGSGETLVVGPVMTTFVRCLGCTKTGYQKN